MTFHKWRQELRASDSGVGVTRVTARVTGLLLVLVYLLQFLLHC